jgi:hypothetical protein
MLQLHLYRHAKDAHAWYRNRMHAVLALLATRSDTATIYTRSTLHCRHCREDPAPAGRLQFHRAVYWKRKRLRYKSVREGIVYILCLGIVV